MDKVETIKSCARQIAILCDTLMGPNPNSADKALILTALTLVLVGIHIPNTYPSADAKIIKRIEEFILEFRRANIKAVS